MWWRSPYVASIGVVIIGLALSFSAWFAVLQRENRLAHEEFDARAGDHFLVLQNGIDQYINDISALRAAFQASEHGISRREFQSFSDHLLREQTAIFAASWIPRVTRDQRPAHELEAARDGLSGYGIKSVAADGSLSPAEEASEYFPIFYTSREIPDSSVYGIDLNDGGIRQRPLERARDEDRAAASPNFVLRRGEGDRNGFFVVLPVYRPGLPHDTVEDRRRNLVGFAQGVFQTGVMIEDILTTMTMAAGLDLYFFAEDSGVGASPLYFHRSRAQTGPSAPLSRTALAEGLHWSGDLRVADRRWTFIAAPIPGGPGTAAHLSSRMILIGGLLISVIMAAYLWSAGRNARHLRLRHQQLGQVNSALDAANARLLLQNARFDTALNNMAQGCNSRYIEKLGLPPDRIRPGVTLGEIIDLRFEAGSLPKMGREEYLLWRRSIAISNEPTDTTVELSNGRIMRIRRQPMPDGGWVATHEDVTERKRAEARIEYLAHHDPLTDLPNRAAFNDFLAQAIESAAKRHEKAAAICIDLDRFKEVNDVFGHAAGDGLLRELSKRLKDAAAGAFLARLGGDEFSLVSTEGLQPTAAERLTARLLAAAGADIEVDGHALRTGLSIGVAIYPTDGADAAALLANADAALYRAKSEGRGSVRFFDAHMDRRLRERRALQQDLRSAIERHELRLNYQPQASIDGNIIGFEALARWQYPTRGTISPGVFIPLAEDSGVIISVGEWILREACRQAAAWDRPLQIAINLSPVQFRHGDLPTLVHSILLETGLAPGRLELEVTESVLIDDFSRAVSILRRLKSLGVRIAMDDFGTGYCSLSYLQAFPFDKIKIDQAFIANLDKNPQSAAIVRAIIGLGRALSLPVTAEGVETDAQLAFLAAEFCTEIQGFLIGKPLPIEDYAEATGNTLPDRRKISRVV
jgi:diguanylate cyclase